MTRTSGFLDFDLVEVALSEADGAYNNSGSRNKDIVGL
jgi:hypothetical protein